MAATTCAWCLAKHAKLDTFAGAGVDPKCEFTKVYTGVQHISRVFGGRLSPGARVECRCSGPSQGNRRLHSSQRMVIATPQVLD